MYQVLYEPLGYMVDKINKALHPHGAYISENNSGILCCYLEISLSLNNSAKPETEINDGQI